MLRLGFGLWRGSFATAVLREIFSVVNAAQQQNGVATDPNDNDPIADSPE